MHEDAGGRRGGVPTVLRAFQQVAVSAQRGPLRVLLVLLYHLLPAVWHVVCIDVCDLAGHDVDTEVWAAVWKNGGCVGRGGEHPTVTSRRLWTA